MQTHASMTASCDSRSVAGSNRWTSELVELLHTKSLPSRFDEMSSPLTKTRSGPAQTLGAGGFRRVPAKSTGELPNVSLSPTEDCDLTHEGEHSKR